MNLTVYYLLRCLLLTALFITHCAVYYSLRCLLLTALFITYCAVYYSLRCLLLTALFITYCIVLPSLLLMLAFRYAAGCYIIPFHHITPYSLFSTGLIT
jgi:hypothetical protein